MKTNKRELTVFAVCAYAVPFLMMPLLYICLQNGLDTSIFANAQMFYPAAGVMLAFLLARPGVIPIPRTGRAEHTLQNARAAEIRLSAEELALLDKAFAPPQRKVRLEIV